VNILRDYISDNNGANPIGTQFHIVILKRVDIYIADMGIFLHETTCHQNDDCALEQKCTYYNHICCVT